MIFSGLIWCMMHICDIYCDDDAVAAVEVEMVAVAAIVEKVEKLFRA